jgi:hypothetical protein
VSDGLREPYPSSLFLTHSSSEIGARTIAALWKRATTRKPFIQSSPQKRTMKSGTGAWQETSARAFE